MKTGDAFDIQFIFLAYVPPKMDETKDEELQTEILIKPSKTTDYLCKIFDSAMSEAKVQISFISSGKQENHIRNNVLGIVQKIRTQQKNKHAKTLTERLHEATDGRNGTGLFAILEGKKANTTRIVLVRFKGDEGLVNHGRKKLLVDHMREVFTKRSNHYKLAVYEDIVSSKSFWKGYAVDKQLTGNHQKPISYFWIEDFLKSKPTLTSEQGTWQLTKVLKLVLNKSLNQEEQEEIVSGIVNLRSKKGLQISLASFCEQYLSPELAKRVREENDNDEFYNSVFTIDDAVYKKELGKTVLTIAGDITAFVPTFRYDDHVTEVVAEDGTKEVTIKGKLSAKKLNVQPKVKQKQPSKAIQNHKKR